MIRRAESRDIPEIGKLLEQVNRVHYEGRPDIFKLGRKYTDEELEEILKDESRPILVFADETDRVCGYAFCVFQRHMNSHLMTDIRTLYIYDLCVDETVRGNRIGRTLYEAVVAFARESGCYNLTLNVWSCNEGALRFYEACGLVPQKIGMELIL
ncbi:MAG: GNAT family N-acetyltransferase [Ruminococcaceae bacterium]|nr:GNAT family N-acetyltransferase [Oscillospiraceae bacterium]